MSKNQSTTPSSLWISGPWWHQNQSSLVDLAALITALRIAPCHHLILRRSLICTGGSTFAEHCGKMSNVSMGTPEGKRARFAV